MGYVPKILIEQKKDTERALSAFSAGDRVRVGTMDKYEKNQWLEGYNCTVKSITKKYVRIVQDSRQREFKWRLPSVILTVRILKNTYNW